MGGIRIVLRSLFEVIVAIGASQTPPLAESGVQIGLVQGLLLRALPVRQRPTPTEALPRGPRSRERTPARTDRPCTRLIGPRR
jgi:hypothetical protein